MDRLGDLLGEIGRLHARLDAVPGRQGPSERGAPGFRSSSPANDDAIVLTDKASKAGPDGAPSVRNSLVGWWETLADAEGITYPTPAATVSDAVALLAGDHGLELLTRHYWSRDLWDECTRLLHALRRACGEHTDLVPIGHCPARLRDAEGPCGGMVRARTFGDAATCRRCGATWRGRLELRRLAGQLGEALADAPGVARYLGIEVSTVRTWAHRDGWTAHKQGRRRLYSLAEARASWEKRQPVSLAR